MCEAHATGEFFRGWRRKAGCVSLVLACVFAAAWIRSCNSLDYLYLRGMTNKWEWVLISGGQKFYVLPAMDLGTVTNAGRTQDEAKIYLLNRPFYLGGRYFLHSMTAKHVQGIFASMDAPVPILSMIPYWIVVAPLTLASAYLLLVKPRIAKPRVVVENVNLG